MSATPLSLLRGFLRFDVGYPQDIVFQIIPRVFVEETIPGAQMPSRVCLPADSTFGGGWQTVCRMMISTYIDQRSGRPVRWRVAYHVKGKRSRRSFKTLRQAEQFAHEVHHFLNMGTDPEAVRKALRICAGTGYTIDFLVQTGLQHLKINLSSTALAKTPTHSGEES